MPVLILRDTNIKSLGTYGSAGGEVCTTNIEVCTTILADNTISGAERFKDLPAYLTAPDRLFQPSLFSNPMGLK